MCLIVIAVFGCPVIVNKYEHTTRTNAIGALLTHSTARQLCTLPRIVCIYMVTIYYLCFHYVLFKYSGTSFKHETVVIFYLNHLPCHFGVFFSARV